jgi:hypothetical protein
MATPQQIIDAIDAQILAIITGGVASYTVPDLTITKLPLDTLKRMRFEYLKIQAEEDGEGINFVDFGGVR